MPLISVNGSHSWNAFRGLRTVLMKWPRGRLWDCSLVCWFSMVCWYVVKFDHQVINCWFCLCWIARSYFDCDRWSDAVVLDFDLHIELLSHAIPGTTNDGIRVCEPRSNNLYDTFLDVFPFLCSWCIYVVFQWSSLCSLQQLRAARCMPPRTCLAVGVLRTRRGDGPTGSRSSLVYWVYNGRWVNIITVFYSKQMQNIPTVIVTSCKSADVGDLWKDYDRYFLCRSLFAQIQFVAGAVLFPCFGCLTQ